MEFYALAAIIKILFYKYFQTGEIGLVFALLSKNISMLLC